MRTIVGKPSVSPSTCTARLPIQAPRRTAAATLRPSSSPLTTPPRSGAAREESHARDLNLLVHQRGLCRQHHDPHAQRQGEHHRQ